jgi:hypothetical protein
LAGKETRKELRGRGADHHGIGRRDALQAGGDVGRLAECQLLLLRPSPNPAHHHQAGMDAQAYSQLDPSLLSQVRIALPQGFYYSEPGPHRPLGLVFVRQGVAEVDQQAVAEVLRDMPLIPGDDLGTGVLIGSYHLAPLFRVELARQRR